MKNNNLRIGLLGFGTVGTGLADILNGATDHQIEIVRICVRDQEKHRSVPRELLTYHPADLIDAPDIDVVVESLPGSENAFQWVAAALQKGKHVITANKKMVAGNLEALIRIQQETGSVLLYESAACASIPIIRSLEGHFGAEPVQSISGIFNGTSNYILTQMERKNLRLETALQAAQEQGFAEQDPSSDLDGEDAKYKLVLLAAHSHGMVTEPESVLHLGIRHIKPVDLLFAQKNNSKIKLLPVCQRTGPGKLAMYVMPGLVNTDKPLYFVEEEYNGVSLEGEWSGSQFFKGKGAGGHPTGSAILADLLSLKHGFQYKYRKHMLNGSTRLDESLRVNVYVRAPFGVPVAEIPMWNIQRKVETSDGIVLIGETNLASLRQKASWLLGNEVFVMQIQGI